MSIIGQKLYDLEMNSPNVTLTFQKTRLIHFSDLSTIFPLKTLAKQVSMQMFDENSEKIFSKG